MTIKQLRAFLVLSRVLNYADAASELCISQAALSVSIKTLETELGGKLFIRTTKKVVLSPEGSLLVPHAKRILSNIEHMENDLKLRFKLDKGNLVIGCMPYIANTILAKIFNIYTKKYNGITLSVQDFSNEKIIESVKDGILELGICFEPEILEKIKFTPLYNEVFVAIVPKSSNLSSKKEISWQELCDTGFVSMAKPSIVRTYIERYCIENNFTFDIVAECNNVSTVCNLVEAGIGVSIIPSTYKSKVNSRKVSFLKVVGQIPERRVGVIYQNLENLSFSSREFIQILLNYFDFKK